MKTLYLKAELPDDIPPFTGKDIQLLWDNKFPTTKLLFTELTHPEDVVEKIKLPEEMKWDDNSGRTPYYKQGFNECIDKVKQLNNL